MNEMLLQQDQLNRDRLCSRDFNRNFLVSAGAGAGKTYTTVERVYNMLLDPACGICPQDIVMITFTIKAATEMKTRLSEKVRKELGKENDPDRKAMLGKLMDSLPEMQISTIHSFCRRILNDYPLESGVGFAPEFESEEGDRGGPLAIWFEHAWQSGRCPECQRLGVKQDLAQRYMEQLNRFPTVLPQYMDPAAEENKALFDAVMEECRHMVRAFYESLGDTKPDIFDYRIRNALLAGEDATDAQAIAAARKIAKDGKTVINWMGKKAGKLPSKACEALRSLLDLDGDSDEALKIMEEVLMRGEGAKGDDRRARIVDAIPMLPDGYREAALMAEQLPDEQQLAELCERIDGMIHAVVSDEIHQLNREYVQERRDNHVITLSDMLIRTAELVRNNPEVRQKLHKRYKVFFVDEYQDTNPVQTDIIFGIAADVYDPDWHQCVPGPGRLFLVGDAKQGIYRFTGADIALWHEVEEVMRSTGGEVLDLNKNYRSTTEICDAVTETFDQGKLLSMQDSEYQVAYKEMVANRGHGPEAIWHHLLPCDEDGFTGEVNPEDPEEMIRVSPYEVAAEQIAKYIRYRVEHNGNQYGDFLILSFNREYHNEYTDLFRAYQIPIKFDGILDISRYRPIELLNLRVQAVCHPFDERLSFRVLCECGDVLPQEWDLFRMNVKRLPAETNLTRYRKIRDLMGHVDELRRLMPSTPMNKNIFRALKMLDDDRKLSQHREPCAFLDELAEMSDGLFRDEYEPEEFQNQYAALKHVIDKIRENNPQQFTDMADLLNNIATGQLDRMPTLRTDNNYVRLMNLHKVKGLQGKILIFLPGRLKQIRPDHNIVRKGTESKGWFVLSSGIGTAYNPPDWKEHKEQEAEFLKAERIRLRYVALTRAEDEAHFFEFRKSEGKRQTKEDAWKGFDGIGKTVEDQYPEPGENEDTEGTDAQGNTVRAEQQSLIAGKTYVRDKHFRRVLPSDLDKHFEEETRLQIQDADGEEEVDPAEIPGGKSWGSVVHRAAELVVREGTFTEDLVSLSAKQAVAEKFSSELLRKRERDNLQLPDEVITLQDIRNWLSAKVSEKLMFMTDAETPFRKMLEGAEAYTEMPFSVSVRPEDGDVYHQLAARANEQQGRRIEISGVIDLALRYPDGSWVIADYKTDRMLPEEKGNREAFAARLDREYGNQLKMYKIILEYLTGETVKETKILSV